MKLAIVIHGTDSETIWNAFRLGVFSLQQGDTVSVFLLGKGVECEQLDNTQFKVSEQMSDFVNAGGKILACGTCLKIRQSEGSDLCPMSTMKDLYEMVKKSDRVLSF